MAKCRAVALDFAITLTNVPFRFFTNLYTKRAFIVEISVVYYLYIYNKYFQYNDDSLVQLIFVTFTYWGLLGVSIHTFMTFTLFVQVRFTI